MYRRRQFLHATLLVVLSSLGMVAQSAQLTWTGCGITRNAFMADLAAAYKQKAGIDIEIEGGGATKGIRQVSAKLSDIGGTCRYSLEHASEEVNAQLIPVAWDALVVVVHNDNPVDSISLQQLRDLYLGKIKNWQKLGGNNQPIDLLVRKGKISGVGYTLRKLLFENLDQTFKSEHVYPSSGPLEKAVEASPNAVAVTGVASAYKRNFKILKLEGLEPSYENIREGNYILYRPLYMTYSPRAEMSRESKAFIQFALSREGREIIRKNQVVPYYDGMLLLQKRLKEWQRFRVNALSKK
jgi:phosphate transport system substrate-binding protein